MASPSAGQPARRLDAVEARHADVHQDDRRAQAARLARPPRGRRPPRRRPRCPGADSSSLRKPARTSAWSSAMRTRVLIASGRRARTSKPPPVARAGLQRRRRRARRARASRSARGPRRRRCRRRAARRRRRPRRRARAARSAARTSACARAGVLERRSSGPPARCGRRTGRRPAGSGDRLALDRQRRPAAPPAATCSTSTSMCSTLGCGSSSSRSSSRRSMPSSRRASASAWRPACSIEASVSRVRRLLGGQRVALGAGLDDHHADVVGDEVVQLARDAGALLGHRLVARAAPARARAARRARRAPRRAAGARGRRRGRGPSTSERDPREDAGVLQAVRARADVVERVARPRARRCPIRKRRVSVHTAIA